MSLTPELWASEALATLGENMVIANLIHRDFSPRIAFSTNSKAQPDSPIDLWREYETNTQTPASMNWM